MQTLMQDVAAAAGVSITTVSHVLNNTRPVAVKTRERVLAAVQHLGYVQNSSARSLVRGSSRVLGLIISNIENPFFTPLIKGFDEACQDAQLELVLSMTNYKQENAEAAVRRMIQDRVRGVAVMSTQFDPALVEQLLARDIPVVLLDDPRLGRNKGSIRVDYSSGIAQAVKRLSALGHHDVAIVHGPKSILSAERFRKVMLSTLKEYGLNVVGSVEGNNQPEGGKEAVQELLSQRVKPTAVLCGNDLMAIGAMSEAMQLGWNVPEDLAIIGSDDIAFAVYSHPSLSTLHIPLTEIGRVAFSTLNGMLEDPDRRGKEITVHTEFVARGSIGPSRGRAERPAVARAHAEPARGERGKQS